MNHVDRRSFLKYCISSATVLGLEGSVVSTLEAALADEGRDLPTVIWLACSNCTGCTVSLANLVSDAGPSDVGDLLLNAIALEYHPNLMGAAGELAVSTLNSAANGDYVLVVEGGVPTAFGGNTCMLWTDVTGHDVTAMEAVAWLAPGAAAVLSVGSCASFGGIPKGNPNPTGIVSVESFTGLPVINIPGCPTHPDWIVWTVAQLITGTPIELDSYRRPRHFFANRIHETCPYKNAPEATAFGQHGRCLEELGCRGEHVRGDCHLRKWNNGTSFCMEAGSICLGCTQPGFPDAYSPFYQEDD
ncbi:MAG: hydrogenase small subunit [Holophagae bacterium]|jgi:hydrogenase small subunit